MHRRQLIRTSLGLAAAGALPMGLGACASTRQPTDPNYPIASDQNAQAYTFAAPKMPSGRAGRLIASAKKAHAGEARAEAAKKESSREVLGFRRLSCRQWTACHLPASHPLRAR